VLDQFAEMGINVVGEREAMMLPEDGELSATPDDETATDDHQRKASQHSTSASEVPPVAYSNVFEGYWDDTIWRTAGGVPCAPTHWMPLPPPPLVLVQR
jgi:hypothetical protein